MPIFYKDRRIATRRADFVVEDVMVEIKAKSQFASEDYVQALNYVKASGFEVGLLLNFGASRSCHSSFRSFVFLTPLRSHCTLPKTSDRIHVSCPACCARG